MKLYQRIAVRLALLLVAFAAVPVYCEWPLEVYHVGDSLRMFLCPTIAVTTAALIVFLAFLKAGE